MAVVMKNWEPLVSGPALAMPEMMLEIDGHGDGSNVWIEGAGEVATYSIGLSWSA